MPHYVQDAQENLFCPVIPRVMPVSDGIIAAAAAQDNTLDPVAARAPLQKKNHPTRDYYK